MIKCKKKKKKGDKKMVQSYENMNSDLVTSQVDKFHYEICGDNEEHLYKDTPMDSNYNKDEFTRSNPISNASEGDSLCKKKKKGDKKMGQNYENMKSDLVTSQVDKFHYEICGDNEEHLYKDTPMDSNYNKDEFTRSNPISNASEGDSLCKKKKKKGDKKMGQKYENMNSDLVTSQVEKFHDEICGDNEEHLYKDTPMDSNYNKDEFTRSNPISNASEGDSLWKKKKKKGDKKMGKNYENMKSDLVTSQVDKFHYEICDDNDEHIFEDETMDSNSNKDEFTRSNPISNASEGDSLWKKKKKGDKKMGKNYENMKSDLVTSHVDKVHYETCDDNDEHIFEDETMDSNDNKDEFTRSNPISNASEGDSLWKKKKKKGDKKMGKNYENMKSDLVTSQVDKFHYEICDDNDEHIFEDETMDSNSNKDEFTRSNPISNASEGDSLWKKKKKGDKKMGKNYENMKSDLVTSHVDKVHYETCDDNDEHIFEDETMDSNDNKDEFTRSNPISNASEGDSLWKKKKKKGDKKMGKNYENMKSDLVTSQVDKFHYEICDDNDEHIFEDETMDSNSNKDEFTRSNPISNASEGDSLWKKKKKGDKKMGKNYENMKSDLVTSHVDKVHYETCDDNDEHIFEDETMDSNDNKDEFTRSNPISNASEGDSLWKKKKKKGDKKMGKNYENMKSDLVTSQVDKFHYEICDDNDEHIFEDETMDSNSNKDEFTRSNPISNASEGDSLWKKKKKGDKKMGKNYENMKSDLVTSHVDKVHYETCDDNDEHIFEDETMDSNDNKGEFTRSNPISNASEGYSLCKKKKKKGDKKMGKNYENMKNDLVTSHVYKFHYETCDDNDEHIFEDETMDSNDNKGEFTRSNPISNASEGDSLCKKKKKKGDKKMGKNYENMKSDLVTSHVDKFHYEICDDNDEHIFEDETMDSNYNKDEFTRSNPISNASEGDSLCKKKKKKGDKKMGKNYENMKSDLVTSQVDKFHYEICDDNDEHIFEDETMDSNYNKGEFTRSNPISNASEGDSLCKKKKKKGDKKMGKNYENMKSDLVTSHVDKFHYEICDDNDEHIFEDETMDSNYNKDEFTRSNPISNASEGDSLCKKKKKKGDKKMGKNYENMKSDLVTSQVDKFHYEICDDNDEHIFEDETMDSNYNKGEFTRSNPISNASEGDSLCKKKKKKGDKKMGKNYENMKSDLVTSHVDKFHYEICDDNDEHIFEDETMDSNYNKDEFTRSNPISNASEGDSLCKKKKKKGDKKMGKNYENMKSDLVTSQVDKFHYEICDDNDEHIFEDETMDSNYNKGEFTRSNPISNASEGDSLCKKKKKKGDKKMGKNYENMKSDLVTSQVDKFHYEICDDNDEHIFEDETMDSNYNKDEFTRSNPISNASEGYSLCKKKKKKGDKKMGKNYENMKSDLVTSQVDKFHYEICDDNDEHIFEDETMDSNYNKDEFTRSNPISNASEGYSLCKKKKKKGDKKMGKNYENMKSDLVTSHVDKFHHEICDDNDEHIFEDETMDSNYNKDEFTRSNPISNASEGDSLFTKKKMKKKRDISMVQNDKHLKNDKSILNVEQFFNETIDDNVKYLNKINISAFNFNKDFTRRLQMANVSEDNKEFTLLNIPLKKVKQKKKKSKIAINVGTESSKYVTVQKIHKNMEDLKENISEEQSNEILYDSGMIKNPYNLKISKVHEQYPELFQKLLKKKKKNKIKSIKVITSKEVMSLKKSNKCKREATDKEYSKNNSPQSVYMDVETYDSNDIGGKKLEFFSPQDDHTSEYCTYTNSNMINAIDNSRTSKVHKEEYAELVKKSLKNQKRIRKAIKDITSKEVMPPKKSNKRIREATEEEYSKNDSPQSVDNNVETCFYSYNYIGEKSGNKLDLFDSRDDRPSEYRNITDTVMYLGQYCNQIFNNANCVFIHENVLTGKIPLRCDVCFKTFISKSKLYVHKRTHTGEKPYTCDVCGRSFSQQGTLVMHNRTHTGEKPYMCNVCGRSFSQQGTLVMHNRTHTGEKPYACDVCGRSFSSHKNLVGHNRTHTGEKPYACDVCGRSFSQQGTLVAHNRTHTGEKPYACDVCDRSFSQQASLLAHKRTHTGEKPYSCNVCYRSFSHQGSLITHNRIHTGEKPYECYYCEKKFIASGDCLKHMRRVHTKCF